MAEKEKILKETEAIPRQLKESLWSERIKILGAGVLGLGGFATAVGTILVTSTQVDVAELRARYAGEKLVAIEAAASAASAAASVARTQAAASIQKRDEAIRETARVEESLRQTREALTEEAKALAFARETKAAVPSTGKLVYVQFRGNLTRDTINELRESLKKGGFNVPGAERVDSSYQPMIKYFKSADKAAAEQLKTSTEAFFQQKGCPIRLRPVLATAVTSSPPLEVWLPHSCNT